MAKDLTPVFSRLRALMADATTGLEVVADDASTFTVDTGRHRADSYSYQFGSVRCGARAVSYHLLPVYYWPDLLDDLDPLLRKRMQGKSCFNLGTVDEGMVDLLDALTRRCVERLRRSGDDLPGQ